MTRTTTFPMMPQRHFFPRPRLPRWLTLGFALFPGMAWQASSAAPQLLDEAFELPPGLHIYRAATNALTGGSYDLAFDGQGRLLVGDGEAVRRLTDSDGDGVYDAYEVIATGLGGRGPQGLLVYGDRLYAMGGDGVQLFSGYTTRPAGLLKHEGRLGAPFNTGGDHAAHTILRGIDGYIYVVSGDGGGIGERRHITRENSPVLFERDASVFRFKPDGTDWECVSAGGRNPPSLGMNYLGDLFSFDSDMEWHVDLPFYRPVRLNHWLVGGDQGWQGVGAYPPYYTDALPGVLEVGRGSPNWGIFYEHSQLPERYADSFLCCDYRWKSASSGGYDRSGRLVAFHLSLDGAHWEAEMSLVAEAKPGGRDERGDPLNFALVDVDVAPDGSLFVTDHNQGIWRLFHDPAPAPDIPAIVPPIARTGTATVAARVDRLLEQPQPASEWSRLQAEQLLKDDAVLAALAAGIANEGGGAWPARRKLRAVRLLVQHGPLASDMLETLGSSQEPLLRAQAAFLADAGALAPLVTPLLGDPDPFVRRRAAEAFTRYSFDDASASDATASLIHLLKDEHRIIRHAAMAALAHRPLDAWADEALADSHPQVLMRTLVAARLRRESPAPGRIAQTVARLLQQPPTAVEDRLDLLRVLGLFREQLQASAIAGAVRTHLTAAFPDPNPDIRWEQTRLLGEYAEVGAFEPLVAMLEAESDPVTQFHIAEALSRMPAAVPEAARKRFINWLLTTESGWFAEFEGKGRQFPGFWATVLNRVGDHQGEALAQLLAVVTPGSLLADAVYKHAGANPEAVPLLREKYERATEAEVRRRIVETLARIPADPGSSTLFLELVLESDDAAVVKTAAERIARDGMPLADYGTSDLPGDISRRLIQAIADDPSGAATYDATLLTLMDVRRAPGGPRQADADPLALQEFWQAWYRSEFNEPFAVEVAANAGKARPDAALHALIVSGPLPAGDAGRGRAVYLKATCFACHGGVAAAGASIFGPSLAGVTRRLNAQELADAIAYPSRQVAERFRATEVLMNSGDLHQGFVTEQNDATLTLTDLANQVTSLRREDVRQIKVQESSLMPSGLLNGMSDQEVADLLEFLKIVE